MKTLSKELLGYCPVCGSDLSEETGTYPKEQVGTLVQIQLDIEKGEE